MPPVQPSHAARNARQPLGQRHVWHQTRAVVDHDQVDEAFVAGELNLDLRGSRMLVDVVQDLLQSCLHLLSDERAGINRMHRGQPDRQVCLVLPAPHDFGDHIDRRSIRLAPAQRNQQRARLMGRPVR